MSQALDPFSAHRRLMHHISFYYLRLKTPFPILHSKISILNLQHTPMSYPDPPNLAPNDDPVFPLIADDFDWNAFFNFDPDPHNPSFSFEDISLPQSEPLRSAPQDQATLLALTASHGAPPAMVTKAISPAVVESSASRQLITSNTITQNQTKRGMQDFLSFFPIDGNSECPPSKRQAFSPDRRIEIAKVRKIKACQRCKMRKLSVSLACITCPRIM
jgi:hypothetical protein